MGILFSQRVLRLAGKAYHSVLCRLDADNMHKDFKSFTVNKSVDIIAILGIKKRIVLRTIK